MSWRRLFAFTGVAVTAFLAGAVACFYLYFERIEQKFEEANDELLLGRTMVLQFIRNGDIGQADQNLEATAWNQIINVGHRVERGEKVPARVLPSVMYHCDYFLGQAPKLDERLVEQRSYWCNLIGQVGKK